ncbi:MAG: ATP-binding cassette domain-containing protein [Gammaproteobacteria bacterium]|nr:ATP-binding cassette domain-containing protein [Gammaproteobacteria bacterium]
MSLLPSEFVRCVHLSKKARSGDSEISILSDVSLSIKRGETVAILGASGSGKTTLLTLLGGLDIPTTGEIYLNGQQLNVLNEEQRAAIRAQNIGFIFQSFQLLPTLTALENVMLPFEIQYISHKIAKAEATEWLKQVGLGKRLHHYPSQLSGGEQQRVGIARAFITRPKIILADEMTGNLDTHTGQLVMDVMFSLNQSHLTTLVLVTHDEHLASKCQSRYMLSEGILQTC